MKKLITMLALMLMLSMSASVYASGGAFSDVPSDYWASNEIQYFVSQNIVSGNGDGTFSPEDNVTREQFCKMLVLTFNAPLADTSEVYFTDVPYGRWSYDYINTCKDMMTGYANPFGGAPAFHPEEYATREDIAVALVRMMGLSDADVKNKHYAESKFSDYDTISPSIMSYVSLAAERGLINGYPNGTFRPNQSITRAEAVVLLNRATKQAVVDLNAELELSVSDSGVSSTGTGQITIITEEGAKAAVDGNSVSMRSTGSGKYIGYYDYKFEDEGTKTFTVSASKAGKTRTANVSVDYDIDAPEITITKCPSSSTAKKVQISGTVKDKYDISPSITVNGELVSCWNGSWSATVALSAGENNIKIVAKNKFGKTSTVKKQIAYDVKAPDFDVDDLPETTTKDEITVSGSVDDYYLNGRIEVPSIKVNGKQVNVYNGKWSTTVTLYEGENSITITATNSEGMISKIVKRVTYTENAPVLNVTNCPETTDLNSVKISGTVQGDNRITVTVNGNSAIVNDNKWFCYVSLLEGENNIKIVAKSAKGKEVTVTKTITFNPGAPKIELTDVPEISQEASFYLQGKISGLIDGVKLYCNDEEIDVKSNGSFSTRVYLNPGDNTFVLRAINSYGNSVSVAKTIKYAQITKPELTVDSIEQEVSKASITVTGSVTDQFDENVKVYVNDKKVASGSGSWGTTVTLEEGKNDIIIVAENKFGKSTTIVKQVRYTPQKEVEKPEQPSTDNTDKDEDDNEQTPDAA